VIDSAREILDLGTGDHPNGNTEGLGSATNFGQRSFHYGTLGYENSLGNRTGAQNLDHGSSARENRGVVVGGLAFPS
jgi:hypothetical protein